MNEFVLSLFPGIGILDRAFEEEGFCVVRGPDVLWGGDISLFHPPFGRFDGVIGGPPCQAFSSLACMVRANGHEPRFGNLIPEFERCIEEAWPKWFLMENVPAAPKPKVEGYSVTSFLLDNVWLGEEQRRKRRFSFGVSGGPAPNLMRWIEQAALELPKTVGAVTQNQVDNSQEAKGRMQREPVLAGHGPIAYGGRYQKGAVTSSDGGNSVRMSRYKIQEMCRLQGLPENFLDESPFTAEGKRSVIANAVPLPMGRALAKAVRMAIKK